MQKKIIVPTDFSPTAATALRYADYLADKMGLQVEVLHVHHGEEAGTATTADAANPADLTALQVDLDDFVWESLEDSPGVPSSRAGRVAKKIVIGGPTAALVQASEEEEASLIVMGGVGTGSVNADTVAFGSVALTVSEEAVCPVLLVPAGHDTPELRHVSLAFGAVSALREMSDKFEPIRAAVNPAVRFVHVRPLEESPNADQELIKLGEALESGFPGYPVSVDILDPDLPALQLLKYSEEEGVDLLVMGRRHKSFLKRFFYGSDITPVIERGKQPMLIIPIADYK